MNFRTQSLIPVMMAILMLSGASLLLQSSNAASPPPDDLVNGTQYIKGDWVVSGSQSYTDELIILTGNLTITSTGSLTFHHVVLRMNCTHDNGEYGIEVQSGGSFDIYDKDSDPSTTSDASNITDSTYDTDDGSASDFRYSFHVLKGASFNMTNSILEEAGWTSSHDSCGLSVQCDDATVDDNTISNCYYGVYFGWSSVDGIEVNGNNIHNCTDGIYLSGTAGAGNISRNTLHHNQYGLFDSGKHHRVYDNIVHNNSHPSFQGPSGMSFSDASDCDIFNNRIVDNGAANWQHNLAVTFSRNINIFNNTILRADPLCTGAIYIRSPDNVRIYDNRIDSNDCTGIYVSYYYDDESVHIHDNNISNNKGYGISVSTYDLAGSIVNITDNMLYKTNGGLDLTRSSEYSIRNNTFVPMYASSDLFFIDDVRASDLSNNTIVQGPSNKMYLRDTIGSGDDTHLIITNSSFDLDLIRVENRWDTPRVSLQNFLHLNVSDEHGAPVPGASVTIRNATGAYSCNGTTDNNGRKWFIPLINETFVKFGYSSTSTRIDHPDPYNVSVTYAGMNAYPGSDVYMGHSHYQNIHFTQKLPPLIPEGLDASPNGTSVELVWNDVPSPDLHHYLVYRNDTSGGWKLIYNSTSQPGNEKRANFTDPDRAHNWTTYFYRVVAVDNDGLHSDPSNIARSGDWFVNSNFNVHDLSIRMNGTLTVGPTGSLTMKNIRMAFNNTDGTGFGIRVEPGGKLSILDNDDDNTTVPDRTNLTAVNPSYPFYIHVHSPGFVMKNSHLENCGVDDLSFYSYTGYNSLYVGKLSGYENRGLVLEGDDAILVNNTFHSNFASVMLHNSSGATIRGNTFEASTFGVYIYGGDGNHIVNNTLVDNDGVPIYILDSHNNSITRNHLTAPSSFHDSIYMSGRLSGSNTIDLNRINGSNTGIQIDTSGQRNNVSDNELTEQYHTSIDISSTDNVLIRNNNISSELGVYGILVDDAAGLQAMNNSIDGFTYGYQLYSLSNGSVSGGSLTNITQTGILISGSSVLSTVRISDMSISSGNSGILVRDGTQTLFENISVADAITGIRTMKPSWGTTYQTFVRIENTNISNNVQNALTLDRTDDIHVYNSTLRGTVTDLTLAQTTCYLFNVTVNRSNISLDAFSRVYIYWYLDVLVHEWSGQRAGDVKVSVAEAFGTVVFTGRTDANGVIRSVPLLELVMYHSYNTTHTPHTIRAIKGNHSGSVYMVMNRSYGITINMTNLDPNAWGVSVSPSKPTTISTLHMNYSYYDPEGDIENGTIIRWYVNGVHNSSFDNITTIPGAMTSKLQSWLCEVIPGDGVAYGPVSRSIPVTILNTRPVALDVMIEETAPPSSDALHVNYTYQDVDGDAETRSLVAWMVNNGSGWTVSPATGPVLPAGYTSKGEEWMAIVTPGDGEEYGAPVNSSGTVTIGNTPPTISGEVTCLPHSPTSSDTLSLNYTFADIDHDAEVAGTYHWYVDRGDTLGMLYSGIDTGILQANHTTMGDLWMCQFSPYDGEDHGVAYNSTTVLIGNTPPIVTGEISILPHSPTSSDNITVEYSFGDADGDDEGPTSYRWFVDRGDGAAFVFSGIVGRSVSADDLEKGSKWKCSVTPHDGMDFGAEAWSGEVEISNSPPGAYDLMILPEDPMGRVPLKANYRYTDPDGDIEAGSEIHWYCNGLIHHEFDNMLMIPENSTAKSQTWSFSVMPMDGEDQGNTILSPVIVVSPNVTIGNMPPDILNLTISPDNATNNVSLHANYWYTDMDGDGLVNVEIRWYRNEQHMALLDDMLSVDPMFTHKQDVWYFEMRAFDGTDHSAWKTSTPRFIRNLAPDLVVSPLTPSQLLTENERITFESQAGDLDSDSLTTYWFVDWDIKRIDNSAMSTFTFFTDYGSRGTYNVMVKVSDGDSEVAFAWSVRVVDLDRAPQLSVVEPEGDGIRIDRDKPLKFSVMTSDPDGDATDIIWTLDGNRLSSNSTDLFLDGSLYSLGNHVLGVSVTDGNLSASHRWNVTIHRASTVETVLGYSYDWWGLVLAVLSGVITAILMVIGFIRVRRKKGKLKHYMHEIDGIEDSGERVRKLTELGVRIRDEFTRGMIEENHYMILEREIERNIGNARLGKLDSTISLDRAIRSEIKAALKDGVMTGPEVSNIRRELERSSISPREKRKLMAMLSGWAREDAAGDEFPAGPTEAGEEFPAGSMAGDEFPAGPTEAGDEFPAVPTEAGDEFTEEDLADLDELDELDELGEL